MSVPQVDANFGIGALDDPIHCEMDLRQPGTKLPVQDVRSSATIGRKADTPRSCGHGS